MKIEEISNKTLREFLTGRLDEATTEELDELSITNGEFADRLAVEQYELVDDWVAGRLKGEDHKAFEVVLARSPALREKVRVSNSLAAAVSTPAVVERPAQGGLFAGLFASMPRFAFGVAGFALLLVIVGVAMVFLRREEVPELSSVNSPPVDIPVASATLPPSASLPSNTAQATPQIPGNVDGVKPKPEPTRKADPLFVTLALAAPTRGVSNIRSLKIGSGVEYVLLSLQTEALSSGRFVVEIGDSTGKTDWRSGSVRGRAMNGRTVVSVRIPAAKAKTGLMSIRLLDANAGAELIDEHVVRIER